MIFASATYCRWACHDRQADFRQRRTFHVAIRRLLRMVAIATDRHAEKQFSTAEPCSARRNIPAHFVSSCDGEQEEHTNTLVRVATVP